MSGDLQSSLAEALGVEASDAPAPVAARPVTARPATPANETVGDRFRRLAREVDEEELGSPSGVLRRAMKEWPDQCAAVQAFAREQGIHLGEAWRRIIAAGVTALSGVGGEPA